VTTASYGAKIAELFPPATAFLVGQMKRMVSAGWTYLSAASR